MYAATGWHSEKEKILEFETGSSRPHSLENSLGRGYVPVARMTRQWTNE